MIFTVSGLSLNSPDFFYKNWYDMFSNVFSLKLFDHLFSFLQKLAAPQIKNTRFSIRILFHNSSFSTIT